jgi:hypothetical protein
MRRSLIRPLRRFPLKRPSFKWYADDYRKSRGRVGQEALRISLCCSGNARAYRINLLTVAGLLPALSNVPRQINTIRHLPMGRHRRAISTICIENRVGAGMVYRYVSLRELGS